MDCGHLDIKRTEKYVIDKEEAALKRITSSRKRERKARVYQKAN